MTVDVGDAIGADEGGQTVAAVVRRRVAECSWNQARSLCRRGHVFVDGEVARDPARRVEAGQRLEVRRRPDTASRTPLQTLILHLDRDVVVVDKPAGLLTVPFEEDDRDTLQHRVQAQLRRRFGPGPPLRVVQRLDKDTTGVLVFARNKRAERALGRQFRAHDVERRYLGLALGRVVASTHRSHLIPDRGDGLRGSWRGAKPPSHAKEAITHVEVEGHVDVAPDRWTSDARGAVTLVSCRLETGRQHQIRIHLAESGHPLVGERVYVRDYRGGFVRGFEPGSRRPLLHAERLGFLHPADESPRRFSSPLPADFRELVEGLGLGAPPA